MQRLSIALAAVVAAAMFVLVPAASSDTRTGGAVWLTSTLSPPCTFTADVSYYAKNAPTLKVFVTQGFTGAPLVPTFVPIKKNTSGTATVALAPLPQSTTGDMFYVWAQLLDKNGVAVAADFASVIFAYCTAP